jgi:zinc D-Ala-D-Ala carboxypeptidase
LKGDHERELWREPWKVKPSSSSSADFKKRLWEHGYLSPHFRRDEAASRSSSFGVEPVPEALRARAQYHAFVLEAVRHELGDRALAPLSWYRSPRHNAEVGGATSSQHMEAWATDWSDATRAALGAERFDAAMHQAFAHGGIGVLGAGPHVRHVDNGPERRWSY